MDYSHWVLGCSFIATCFLKKGVVFASQPATMGANVNEITATFCSLPDTTVFTVALEADVVKDNGNNHISNVAVANPAWTFKTADNTVPAITEWLPVVTNAEKSVTISVKASEVVDKVAGKKVTIVNGTVNLVFDVADMVTADGGKTWTKVVDNLLDKTTYTVTVEAGAFRDKSCAPNPTALAMLISVIAPITIREYVKNFFIVVSFRKNVSGVMCYVL